MSIWTSRRSLRLLAVLALLAASGPAGADDAAQSLTVTTGKVRIAGPDGYCADRAGSRDGGTQAFVLLAPCAVIRGDVRGNGAEGAVLTAQVLLRGLANGEPMAVILPEMERFFRSAAGRQALSRSGRAATVEVVETARSGEVLYIRARDRSPMKGVAVEPEYWRAVMTVKGRMVTLSVLGRAAAPIGPGAKRSLLDAFVARVRRMNGSS
jgi:hypothetical protein